MTAALALPWLQLCGMDESHLVAYHCPHADKDFLVHHEVHEPLKQLVAAAAADGHSLQIVSAYRSFSRQQDIWNRKWSGDLPCRDAGGQIIDLGEMGEMQKLWLILSWSAFPGLSRHHWGTDFDIFDAKAIAEGHRVELLPREFRSGGPCFELNNWLAAQAKVHQFFRPYSPYAGGVAEEPWHISFAPLAQNILQQTLKEQNKLLETLKLTLLETAGAEVFLQYFDTVCQRFLHRINPY